MEGNVELSFHNIRYEVLQKITDSPWSKSAVKEILCNVSGVLPPGLNAIMGATGSGKTSLLDILAQRKDPKGLKQGAVLLNGKRPPDNFRLMSGYVVQDDIVMGTLTVKENLAFSANLRLSTEKFTATEKAKKVEEVIRELGLEACANSMVGTEFVRGISGGERKRVNIGMELILDPPILFLDEPTTGLDSNTANSIVLLLHNMSQSGRNIIMSIHQPRFSIFSLFNRLILLNKGELVYSGASERAVDYFESIGYECSAFNNPADFFLDVLGGDVNTMKLINDLNKKYTKEPGEAEEKILEDTNESPEEVAVIDEVEIQNDDVSKPPSEDEDLHVETKLLPESTDEVINIEADGATTDSLAQQFQTSTFALEEKKELQDILSDWKERDLQGEGKTSGLEDIPYANSFDHQLRVVTGRTLTNIVRNPMATVVQLIVMLMFGTIIGSIYFQVDNSIQSGLQNRAGCFFFLVMSQVMSNVSALTVFIRNRTFFRHESASGYYKTSVYFISQVFADIIPNRIVPNFLFSLIIYFMIGFQPRMDKFLIFVLALTMTALSAVSIAFMVSASVQVISVASVLVSVPYIIMMLFGGFLANVTSMLSWLEWLKYFSVFRYGINALTINEMSGLVFIENSSYPGYDPSSAQPCYSDVTNSSIPNCILGEDYMIMQGISTGTWALLLNFGGLFLFITFFMVLSYVQLRRINKFK